MSSGSDSEKPKITIVGLGPAGPELLTAQTLELIASSEHRFVRTMRHDASEAVGAAQSFDEVYDSSESMPEVYQTICDRLVEFALQNGDLLYAVPGSPRVAESTVGLLVERTEVEVEVVPALSFIDLCWARLGVDPIDAGVRIIDGHRFTTEAAGERGPLLICQCDRPTVMSEIKLAIEDWPTAPVTVVRGLGHADEQVFEVPFGELDRVEVDHLTSLYIPELTSPVGVELMEFWELVRRLRSECEWDAKQTNKSLKKYLLEETYELIEAIDDLDMSSGEGSEDLEEELGDVLFQVYFHSVIASELGWFDLADVARGVHDKLKGRHPHVFGDADPNGDLVQQWEDIKAEEKGRSSVIEGVPRDLPALAWTQKLQKRAATVKLGDDGDPFDTLQEGLPLDVFVSPQAVNISSLGEFLFGLVAAATKAGIDAEDALRQATGRFVELVKAAESN